MIMAQVVKEEFSQCWEHWNSTGIFVGTYAVFVSYFRKEYIRDQKNFADSISFLF